jgi:carbonic anhydrase/acetyltransferase-like protein (isoleucine patch superfamily)
MIRAFEGRLPGISESAFVSEMAYLVGDITVGERASLWPFVCARGDFEATVVGEATNVQEFTMLHGAVLGDRVSVGHGAVIDEATVGEESLIGISSSVLSGATVGSHSIVAAGAVVTEGEEVPDEHVAYGVPAETRPLTDEQAELIRSIREEYLEMSARYAADGNLGTGRPSAEDGSENGR